MGIFRYTKRTFMREIALVLGAAVFFIPFYLLVTLSVKSYNEIYLHPLKFPTSVLTSNYSTAWNGGSGITLGHALINSVIVTVCSVVGLIALGSICAYTLARRPGKLSTIIYTLFLLGIILPFQLGIVPLFVAFKHLHLIPTYQGMILLNIGIFMPLTVFLYTGFIRSLPKEYEEAAQIDGARLFRTYVRVVFPLLRPVTGTVAVLTGIATWNEFFVPLIFLSGSKVETLPIAIYSFVGEYTSQWNVIFAAVTIAFVPIIAFYLFAQRHLIRGFSGGIRG
jgi:raffinose/stachyose/melibiose transport system permease protein